MVWITTMYQFRDQPPNYYNIHYNTLSFNITYVVDAK
jgi:hypothetical protein